MISTCLDKKFNKDFKYGSKVALIRPTSKACQLLLAQQCSLDSSRGCLDVSLSDTYSPGFDIFSRPIQQTMQDAYLRNIAQLTFVVAVPNCTLVQNEFSLEWRNTKSFEPCKPEFSMTPHQIEAYRANINDSIIGRLVAAKPKFDDILLNIKRHLKIQNNWNLLAGTPFFIRYSNVI